MNKQELKQAIQEGIDESIYGQALKGIMYGLFLVVGVIFILFIISNFIVPQPKVQAGMSQSNMNCGSEMLTCTMYNLSTSPREIIYSQRICGYGEANNLMEYYNKTFGGNSKLELLCG